ncbi:MAG TPA: hypothetical protein VLD57_07225 [Blastocatellia bacterium]|nr:hypothetical protein [Blastocatellia bacterium]
MQGRRPPGEDPKTRAREREHREAMLRTIEARAAVEKMDAKQVEAAIKQVQDDFKQLQIVRNQMVRNLLANKPLDYRLISGEAGDINKRADRLRFYLMPPTPEGQDAKPKSQIEYEEREMKDALIRLCNLIATFIDNPVLQSPATVDVEQSMKAGGELLSIIELSDNVKRSAERLRKTSR